VGAQALPGVRHVNMESIYEYGSRVGVWRLLDLFERKAVPLTVFAVAMAAERHPQVIQTMVGAGHEIASHGYRWIDYQYVGEEVERQHMRQAIEILTRVAGSRPLGWYTGRCSPNTLRLVVEEGGSLYCADSYADDLPYWVTVDGRPQLIVPYTLDANDMRFATAQGFNSGEQFFAYLRDSFDVLYAEGARTPRMMSIGLHCRLVGRAGRIAALERFIDHAKSHENVWFCRRIDIARHWQERHPYRPPADAPVPRPSQMEGTEFVRRFGGVFEHSPWVAEAAWRVGLWPEADSAESLHAHLCAVLRTASPARKLELLRAHPELAGRLAVAGQLTDASSSEQASAGLNRCTPDEYARFQSLNADYQARFGFPFIMAVKGRSRQEILAAFERRLENDRDEEMAAALGEVEKIALLRLKELLP
jgi:OHCU decarboxylase